MTIAYVNPGDRRSVLLPDIPPRPRCVPQALALLSRRRRIEGGRESSEGMYPGREGGKALTPDQGGSATTTRMAVEVLAAYRNQS